MFYLICHAVIYSLSYNVSWRDTDKSVREDGQSHQDDISSGHYSKTASSGWDPLFHVYICGHLQSSYAIVYKALPDLCFGTVGLN